MATGLIGRVARLKKKPNKKTRKARMKKKQEEPRALSKKAKEKKSRRGEKKFGKKVERGVIKKQRMERAPTPNSDFISKLTAKQDKLKSIANKKKYEDYLKNN